MNHIYALPLQFMDDTSVPLHWKLYAFINGFWIGGKTFFASNEYLAKRFDCDERTIPKLLETLETMGLVQRTYEGGRRMVMPAGVLTMEGGAPARHTPMPSQGTHTIKRESLISEAVASREYVVSEEKTERLETAPPPGKKYPHAREVFTWFPKPQKSWGINKTELAHAELLWERGEATIRSWLSYVEEHKDEPYFPSVTKPSDLERKAVDIKAWKDRKNS